MRSRSLWEAVLLIGVRVVHPRGAHGHAAERQTRRDHGCETGEARRERILTRGVGHRRPQLPSANGEELRAQGRDLLRHLGHLRRSRIGHRRERPDRLEHALLHVAPDAPGPEVVLVHRGHGGNGHVGGGQRRMERPVEREPLQWVVERPGDIEVASRATRCGGVHPSLRPPSSGGGEVGLVGVRVADGRDHRHLALGVELGQRVRVTGASAGSCPRRRAGRRSAPAPAVGGRSRTAGARPGRASTGSRHRRRGRPRAAQGRARPARGRCPPRRGRAGSLLAP